MKIIKLWTLAVGSCVALNVQSAPPSEQNSKPNVLFLCIDDLRPELGCYGVKEIKTPHIDAIASKGILFERAYCQIANCNPSRSSFLTGRRPDTTKIYELESSFRQNLPDVVTLPEYFKQHGYFTQSIGKVFHGGIDDAQSWSVPSFSSGGFKNEGLDLHSPETIKKITSERDSQMKARENSWEAVTGNSEKTGDGNLASKAIEAMETLTKKDQPFFLAVGFRKPHLPFRAPQKYFDMYPLDKVPLSKNPNPPKDAPEIAFNNLEELRTYKDIQEEGPIPESKARELVRGYYASTTFVDDQIGRLMEALDRLKLSDHTIVFLLGDHGFHLGEHGHWAKLTAFESSTRAPLIFCDPGVIKSGIRTKALVEFVDVYPTVCELAGLQVPSGLEGTSMLPLMKNPELEWKSAAFSQVTRGIDILLPLYGQENKLIMGYTIRTDRYRYTEWKRMYEPGTPVMASELYDHEKDPGEDINIASAPESKSLVGELSLKLSEGWKNARPSIH
jgi:iduronate 2-sulfatase